MILLCIPPPPHSILVVIHVNDVKKKKGAGNKAGYLESGRPQYWENFNRDYWDHRLISAEIILHGDLYVFMSLLKFMPIANPA